jgi:[protein-PII] uridylyltransferase
MDNIASLKNLKIDICNRFKSDLQVGKLTKSLSKVTDEMLSQAWADSNLNQFSKSDISVTLIAVGGYGRKELFPFSDVDILVLIGKTEQQEIPQELSSSVEKFISHCWDLGLEIGSSVRSIDECLEESAKDITVKTSLLESRFLEGNKKLYQSFVERFESAMDAKSFYQAKLLELRQRHHKYQDTPYSLEPNCKESPGGLRDLQVILWTSKAAKLGNSFDDLFKKGLITKREAVELNKNQKLIQTIRATLHLVANRRQDVLVFDFQNQLAQAFGLKDTEDKRASEQIMRRYYWAAKAVTQLNEILIQNIEALLFPTEAKTTRPISEHFIERQGLIDIIDANLFEKQPEQILHTFLLFCKTPGITGLSTQVLRGLYNARQKMNAQWRNNPVNRETFMEIVKQSTGVARAFDLMNQTSVLGRYIPAFRKIVGQMQHDLFHVYTVDQHILTVLRNVRRFSVAELAHEFPYCSQLAANYDKKWLLVLAALFHDIAKGRGGDHSALGRKDALIFAKKHQLSKEDATLLVWLVAEHLTMSQIAQKQDIGDPDVINAFATKVQNEKYLTALYLLTVADVRGTSPKVWNAWKGKLLEDLYRYTLRFLGGAKYDAHSQLQTNQDEAKHKLRLYGLMSDAHEELWKQLDVGFFLKQDSTDIAWLTRHLYSKVNTHEPVVRARLSPSGEGLQVAVYLKDQPDLFARICAYFDQQGFSIWDAHIHTTHHGFALDTFQISGSNQLREGGHYRDLIQLVEHGLTMVLQERSPLPEARTGRVSRQSRIFPIQARVNLKIDDRGELFVLSLSASDRTGLLYAVAKVLAKYAISLRMARINTLGERVEDTLLLDGEKLIKQPKLQLQLETELLEALTI